MNNRLYKLMNWAEIEEITYSESSDPHLILGPHKEGSKTLLQAFFPGAEEVTVQWDFDAAKKDFKEKPMELADEDDFFAVLIARRRRHVHDHVPVFVPHAVDAALTGKIHEPAADLLLVKTVAGDPRDFLKKVIHTLRLEAVKDTHHSLRSFH